MKMTTFVRGAASSRNWKNRMRLLLALIFLKVREVQMTFVNALLQQVPPGNLFVDDEEPGQFVLNTIEAIQESLLRAHIRVALAWQEHTPEGKKFKEDCSDAIKPPHPVRAVKRTFTEYTI